MNVTLEINADAMRLLTDEEYWRQMGSSPPEAVGGPFRLALVGGHLWSTERPNGFYMIEVARERADWLAPWCEEQGEVLKTFPEEHDRANGAILLRAARDIRESIKRSAREG